MDWTPAGIAALVTAVLGVPSALYAGWRALRRSIRKEMEDDEALETALEAVEAKNAENEQLRSLIAAKDITIAELTALLDEATRPGRAR